MNQTTLFPPFTTIRTAWAITGKFSKEEESKLSATIAEDNLKDIQKKAEKIGGREQQYVDGAIATTLSSMRSLEIVLKGRNLNFDENQKLRDIYLENIRDNIAFGENAKDFLKSLPTMSVATGIGTISIKQLLENLFGLKLDITTMALIGLSCAGIGYFINILKIIYTRKNKQLQYIAQDYERNVYYDQYISRVKVVLTSLYEDIDRTHRNIFGDKYPTNRKSHEIIDDLLKGVRSTMCKFVHKHMAEKKITPDLWHICETGGKLAGSCRLWEDVREEN
jgi:hypothetical protein